ncbi:hypothetical protein P5673_015157 [Acropora cervicornis]|uniref:Uncharacterized protein n=1 Tax=Acropora cervicornis TaxID=6130 RepID=A0AAD9QIA1_ACRCE|nr:hypothetical protein P5673_015157 [Acropora cervicornis]
MQFLWEHQLSLQQQVYQIVSKDSQVGNGECVRHSSPLFKLNPLVRDGLLHVGGRLTHTPISSDAKHQIIIPKGSHISNLIISQALRSFRQTACFEHDSPEVQYNEGKLSGESPSGMLWLP